jgi:hypothetical protein
VGVRGVKALMENDIVSGIQFGFSMLTIALSIIVGLFVANMLFPLRKAVPKPSREEIDLALSQEAEALREAQLHRFPTTKQ